MNLEELRSVQRAERQKDSLQHLRDSFYADVAAYIAQLKDERERAVEAAADPFASDDVRQLTDKIEATTEIANALYERRVGKVVKHASFAAADMATDEDGMTAEERDLFEDLVARIRENRETVLATLEGAREGTPDPATGSTDADTDATMPTAATEADATDPDPDAAADPADDLLADALGDAGTESDGTASTPSATQSEPTDTDAVDDDRPAAEPAAAAGPSATRSGTANGTAASADTTTSTATNGRSSAAADDRATPDTDRTTLRITADVGTVYGVDEREYDLAREDVVDLPTTNAEPLLEKNAAERID